MIKAFTKHMMSMLKSESTETMQTPVNQEMVFYLTLKNLDVGRLCLRDGTWTYEYTEDFKRQSRIQPLVDFPTPTKVYTADSLWPFFSSRIPTPNQPHVQDVIDRKKIDLNNTAEMLKEFGHRTIANPFALQVMAHS